MEVEQATEQLFESSSQSGKQISTRQLIILAAVGGFFVIDSVILYYLRLLPYDSLSSWVNDRGTLAATCALIGVVLLLSQIVRLALRSKDRGLGLKELVILAVVASIVQASGAVDGTVALYTAGAVAFFMLLSLIIESQSAVGARTSLEELVRLTPGKARVITSSGDEQLIDPAELTAGQRLQIRPGETVYADGHIIKGASSLQESNITGESLPVDKDVGDVVFAGTLNLSGLIEVNVERAGANTTLGKVRQLILEAERTRLPFVRMIDQYVRYYTPVIVMLSVIVWFATEYSIDRVAALLVAACPVALILATPSATIAAISAAARLGVLIKNVNDIENLSRIDAFVMDKTGTLTKGELGVVRIAPVQEGGTAELLRYTASAEQRSNHPVALAVRDLATKARVKLYEPEQLHEQPGRGVRATVAEKEIIAGNLAWMQDNGLQEDDFPQHDKDTQGVSLLYVMLDGKAMGWIALEDQVRADAAEVIQELNELNVGHVALVTGDRTAVAKRVAADLGIQHFRGDCVPAEKVDYVEDVKQTGQRTVFVGDGVNDGPALAASHIGIAMGAAGSDVAMESASIALLNNRLNRLPFLLRLARRTRSVMVQNFIIGGVFIIGGMILGSAGRLPPLAAAIVQVLSSIIVIMNSARLVREGDDIE
jgi:Cd2+/Zn2+-exporting ATPase